MFTLESAVTSVVCLIVGGLIFGLLDWLVDYCATPEPFRRVAKVALAVLAVLVVVGALLSLLGHPIVRS